MDKIKVKTYSPTTSKAKITLTEPCAKVLIKNFGDESIYIGTTQDSTKTNGMIRIPPSTAQFYEPQDLKDGRKQVISELYLQGDAASSNTVEIMEMR